MSLPHMVFLVQPRPLHRSSCVFLWPSLHSTVDYFLDNQVTGVKFCCHNAPLRCSTIPLAVGSYVAKRMPLAEAVADEASEFKDMDTHSESISCSNSHHKDGSGEIGNLNGHQFEGVMTCSMSELKETLRRRRIGLANKGKVPWNKGRRHTPETCARIKERTLEAMRDPKVKRKMSEAPRTHSEQSKKKIGSSLKQLWAQRLKLKRSKEKFYSSWTASVAEAARKGGVNEDQFYWDSYEMQKKEIAGRKHQQVEEKAKERVLERIQAVKRAQVRAQNLACHAVKKRGHKNKGEPRAKHKVMKSCKIRKKNEELVVSSELSLNSSLTKIDEKKSIDGQFRTQSGVMSYLHSALEKFNLEAIREQQERKTISLADQIQAAKNKRHRLSRKDPQ